MNIKALALAALASVSLGAAVPAPEAKAASMTENIRSLCTNGRQLNSYGQSAHALARSYVRSQGQPAHVGEYIIMMMRAECPSVW